SGMEPRRDRGVRWIRFVRHTIHSTHVLREAPMRIAPAANNPVTPIARQNQRSGSSALNIATAPMMHVTPRMKKNSAANLYVLCVTVWDGCRTMQLTDRRALTCQSSKTPRHRSPAQMAVRCSDLVRQSKVHRLKNLSGPTRL